MSEKFNAGDIVKSMAGHDKDKFFVVLSSDGIFAHIANGKLRKADKPKIKKLKHLENTGCTYEKMMGVQFERQGISNPKLKKAINNFKNIQSL